MVQFDNDKWSSKTQIFYLCNLCKCLQFFHSVYIGGEHKTHVVQVNNKNHNLKILNFSD
jgi:hypothetical protein